MKTLAHVLDEVRRLLSVGELLVGVDATPSARGGRELVAAEVPFVGSGTGTASGSGSGPGPGLGLGLGLASAASGARGVVSGRAAAAAAAAATTSTSASAAAAAHAGGRHRSLCCPRSPPAPPPRVHHTHAHAHAHTLTPSHPQRQRPQSQAPRPCASWPQPQLTCPTAFHCFADVQKPTAGVARFLLAFFASNGEFLHLDQRRTVSSVRSFFQKIERSELALFIMF